MLHCRDGIGLVMSGAWFPPNMTPGIHAKEFNLCLIRPENFVSHGLRVLQVHLPNSSGLLCAFLLRSGFHLATLPYRPDWWIAAEMVVLLEGSPLSTEERWRSDRVTIGFLVTSLTKALLPGSLSLEGRPASSRKSPGSSELLPFTDDQEATVLIGTFKAAEIFLYPSPDLFLKTILSRRSTDNSFDFMLGLCSDMHCQLWDLI